MKKFLIPICFLFVVQSYVVAQDITINHQLPTQPIPSNYDPGIFLVPKTLNGGNDFLNNGIHFNSIRGISIENALNYWTVSSINGVMAELEAQKSEILLANDRCDKLVLPILKMPAWLSSSSDTASLGGGFMVLNAMPPADYNVWNLLMDSIVSKINDQWGLDPYYEIWNEPDGDYWQGTTEEYFEFYKNTFFAIKDNHPNAKVGGPVVSGFISQFNPTLTNGYLTNSQLDSTITGMVIDSCVGWGATMDFISWHKFGVNLYNQDMIFNYLDQKLVNSGHGIVPYMISEWNLSHSLRESPLDAAFMINYTQGLESQGVVGHQIAAWQDFDSSTTEFHGDYGLLSWGALHKPSWKSILLLNKMKGSLISVDGSDYRNLNVISTYENDTLKILVSNFALPPEQEALMSLYFEQQVNASELLDSGYTASMMDSILNGLITLSGPGSLTQAINNTIPMYQTANNYFQNGRDVNLKVPGIIGSHNGTITWIDSTKNNVIYTYDSLINDGYTRLTAVNFLYPNNYFDSESTVMTDSVYSFNIKPNAVALIELYIPQITVSSEQYEVNDNLIIYPNPATDLVHIKHGAQKIEWINIYDVNGRLVESVQSSIFSIINYVDGIYFLEIKTDKGVRRKKLVKN